MNNRFWNRLLFGVLFTTSLVGFLVLYDALPDQQGLLIVLTTIAFGLSFNRQRRQGC